MKKRFAAMTVLLVCLGGVFAQIPADIKGLFSAQTAAELEKNRELTGTIHEDGKIPFLPELPLSREIALKIAAMKPTFGAVACVLHVKPGSTFDDKKSLIQICNTLYGVSTLKGILYFSQSRQKMREFFIDSYRIESPEKKGKLSDIWVSSEIPAHQKIYTFQNDSSFGENIFEVDYQFDKNYFLMKMVNTNLIWYGIIPIIDPGNLIYYIIVYPRGDYLLFYSVICVKGANPFGLMESKADSFYNRIKALDSWFMSRSGLF